MNLRSMAFAAMAMGAISCAAQAEDALSALKACRAQADDKARLACFDAALVKLDAAPVTAQAPAPVIGTPADFGGENLAHAANAPKELDSVTVGVAKVAFNPLKHFIVTLDNGQVWRQLESDTEEARFPSDKPAVVKISKGFMGAYRLEIEGTWGGYQVKRVK